jgi:hypothetical protein
MIDLSKLTEEERAAWKRCEKATAGPWVQWKGHSSVFSGTPTENTVGTLRGYHAFLFEINDDDLPRKEARADAAFIAHARTDLPAALATIAALREENRGLRERVGMATEYFIDINGLTYKVYLSPGNQAWHVYGEYGWLTVDGSWDRVDLAEHFQSADAAFAALRQPEPETNQKGENHDQR